MRISTNQSTQMMYNRMMQQQISVADKQHEIATGLKISKPSDNPAVSGQLLGIEEASSQLMQYNRNATAAESRLGLEETALTSVSRTVMRLRELALSANSGAVDDATRAAVMAEVEQRIYELYDTANSKDANGDYLFSGSNVGVRPFHRDVPVYYAGSDDVNQLQVGIGRTIELGDSGMDVFMRIKNGNGDFQTFQDPANTGNALISPGDVTDSTAYNNQSYTIEFTSQNTYDILESGTPLQTGVSYIDGGAVEFGGISVNLRGRPETGDIFSIEPSINQDIFSSVEQFMDALQQSPANDAQRSQQQHRIDTVINNFDLALDHINAVRSGVGVRLNSIESGRDENAAVNLQLNTVRAEFQDADLTDSVIQLQHLMNSLEALQKSYIRTENMSLFTFL